MSGKPRITQWQHAMKYFAALMALVYMAAGVALVAAMWSPRALSREYQVLLGVMLIAYGIFRGYRFYQNLTMPEDE